MTTPKEAAERLADSCDVEVDENVTADRPSQATEIVDMARTVASLWHSDEGVSRAERKCTSGAE